MPERQVGDEEFLDITSSRAEARLLRKALQQLSAGGAGETLQEMAREVLTGRLGLRDAVSQSTYGEELISRTAPFRHEWESMSDQERERLAEQGRQLLEQEHREIEAEERGTGGNRPERHSNRSRPTY